MSRLFSILLLGLLASATPAQESSRPHAAPPDWFTQNVEYRTRDGGRWLADNAKFRSENEAWDAYGVVWVAGPGNASMTGRLFGVAASKDSAESFWVFSQYWDPGAKRSVVEQYGWGVIGLGTNWPVGDAGESWMLQTFTGFDGVTRQEGHRLTTVDEDTHDTTSYDVDESGKWTAKRTYRWRRASAMTP